MVPENERPFIGNASEKEVKGAEGNDERLDLREHEAEGQDHNWKYSDKKDPRQSLKDIVPK
jgi:hypothetical protein